MKFGAVSSGREVQSSRDSAKCRRTDAYWPGLGSVVRLPTTGVAAGRTGGRGSNSPANERATRGETAKEGGRREPEKQRAKQADSARRPACPFVCAAKRTMRVPCCAATVHNRVGGINHSITSQSYYPSPSPFLSLSCTQPKRAGSMTKPVPSPETDLPEPFGAISQPPIQAKRAPRSLICPTSK